MGLKYRENIVKFLSIFIINKSKRKKWRREHIDKIKNDYAKSIIWGVSYSVFDGEELLEASIMSIRDCVDYVNVVYQTKSWYGTPANKNLVSMLKDMQKRKIIDELIEYVPQIGISAFVQEKTKRNLGLEYAKKHGVKYFMTMDCDEFYKKDEFRNAQNFIIKNDITHSYCDIFNYYSPTLRFLQPTPSYINFFSKIDKNSKLISNNKKCICSVDLTRMLNDCRFSKYWFLASISMHHMTCYRKDLYKKINNSTAKDAYNMNIPKPINCVKVDDIFKISGLINGEIHAKTI